MTSDSLVVVTHDLIRVHFFISCLNATAFHGVISEVLFSLCSLQDRSFISSAARNDCGVEAKHCGTASI